MPSPAKLLQQLEQFDTYPADAALSAAIGACLGETDNSELHDAATALTAQFTARAELWQELVQWADERLNAWHSLKVQAIESAWRAYPHPISRDDRAAMEAVMRQVLTDLRQGLNDHPDLVADGYLLQALAKTGQMKFTQAVRELRNEGVALPSKDELDMHVKVTMRAFQFLIPAPTV